WTVHYAGDNVNAATDDQGGSAEQLTTVKASPAIITNTSVTTTTGTGQFGTIGFWHNKNGQALIKSFNGSASSTLLGNSLATNFANLFGRSNPYTVGTLGGVLGAAPG